jgi:hypothetical protein
VAETRRLTFEGGPVGRALVQVLQEEGVTVTGSGRPATEYRDARDIAEGVVTTLVATGAIEAIRAGVRRVRWRFPKAKIEIEDKDD